MYCYLHKLAIWFLQGEGWKESLKLLAHDPYLTHDMTLARLLDLSSKARQHRGKLRSSNAVAV